MKTTVEVNKGTETGQEPAWDALKQRTVVTNLCANGFSQERAEELWNALDHTKGVEALIADAIFCGERDNTEAVHGTEEKANNGELPPDVVECIHRAPDFDVPPGAAQGKAETEQDAVYEEVDPDDLENIPDDLDPEDKEKPFPIKALDLFPNLLQAVQDWMRQLDMPALLPVVCALVALSAALGRGLRVRNSKGQTYPNIFALMGAESGTGKSLVYNEAMRPLEEMQLALDEAFKAETKELRASLGLVKNEIGAILHNHLKAEKGGTKLSPAEEQAARTRLAGLYMVQEQIEDRLARPPCVWTSDFTSEALGARLASSEERLAVLSDEGGIALYNLEGRYADGDMTDDILLTKCFSVNAHAVDRIGRGRITLKLPCIALLLMVQPDLLQRAFRNERLLLGGFLARCLSADSKLEMQEEEENDEDITFDAQIASEWSLLVKGLYAKYHESTVSHNLQVAPEVRVLSRRLHNTIVRRVKGRLKDVRSFAARWREITWKLAIVLHAALYGIESEHHPLEVSTFEAAREIVTYFSDLQLEVLAEMRLDLVEKTHARLQELFLQYDRKPITVRDLTWRHKVQRDQLFSCVKSHSEVYVMMTETSPARRVAVHDHFFEEIPARRSLGLSITASA